jgi:hypothetical protein
MAASAWKVYNRAKMRIAKNALDLDGGSLRMGLYKDGSNASNFAHSVFSQLNSVVTGGGYTGAKTLTASVVSVNASTVKFTIQNVIFTASNANISSVLYAVIYVSGGSAPVVCWSKLSTAVFDVVNGNTLTIAANATDGIFKISGGTA